MSADCNLIISGVGGQGVLSLSSIMGLAAIREGLDVKQSEVHGMAQRGGAVMAHLRVSDRPIASGLVPKGRAHLIVGLEPVESLRYLGYLSPTGTIITSLNPVVNIPNYPDMDDLIDRIAALPSSVIVDCERLAREAGSVRSTNVVLIGVASKLFPVRGETLEQCIEELFAGKGRRVVETNIRAFHLGRERAPDVANRAHSL